MSFQNGTATDVEDLLQKLSTFLQGTPGWTEEEQDTTNRKITLRKTAANGYVNFGYAADFEEFGIWLSTGFTGPSPPVNPWQQPGAHVGTAATGAYNNVLGCNPLAGPYPGYHFFEDDEYCHVVIERATGIYRHFGFGNLTKLGTWTGGFYAYNHYWNQGVTAIDNPLDPAHGAPLGGQNQNTQNNGMVVRANGLPDENVATDWLVEYWSSIGNDSDGNPRGACRPSGWRDSLYGHMMGAQTSQLNGFKPLMPIPVFQQYTVSNPDRDRLLGHIPDVRAINMAGLTPGVEISVGGETWIPFPITRVGNEGLTFDQEQSYNFGLAYRKVTT